MFTFSEQLSVKNDDPPERRELQAVLAKALDLVVRAAVPIACANKALSVLEEELEPRGFNIKKHHITMNSELAHVKRNDLGSEDDVVYECVKIPYEMENTIDDMSAMLAAQGLKFFLHKIK